MNGANKESRRAYTKIRKDKNGGTANFQALISQKNSNA